MALLKNERLIEDRWNIAWKNKAYRIRIIVGIFLMIAVLAALPHFFQHIEKRDGFVLNDFVLDHLGPADISIPLFVILWFMALLFAVRCFKSPAIFTIFLYSYFIVTISRLLTISLVPLNPPHGLIPLIDPISNQFYGKSFITKDLFYSGHTSSAYLMFLCFRRKIDKFVGIFCTIAVGFLVLMQHVHYTIDVLAAPVATSLCYWIGKKLATVGISKNHH
ncbi:MAG: hypothetical protein C4330_07765 [Chitinophagaceae bacterium]